MKYEVCRSNTVRVIALQQSVDRRTDRQTDGRTDRQSDYYRAPASSMAGPKYLHFQCFLLLWTLGKFWQPFFSETVVVTYELAVPVAVLNTALLCSLKRIFHRQKGTILIKYKYKDWLLLFHSVMKDRGTTCKFRNAQSITLWETNK